MKPCNSISELKNIHFFAQFTDAQLRKQVRSSASGLRDMHAKSVKTGKKVGGFTADQLNSMAARLEKISAS